MKKTVNTLLALALVTGLTTGCNDLLEFPLENEISAEEAIQTADDLQALLVSCYDVMGNTFNGESQNFHEIVGPNLDNPNNDDYTEAWNHNTLFFNGTIGNYFKQPYITIYRCNTIMQSFDFVSGLGDAERTRMEAEARFLRALCHWDAVRLFAQPYGFTADNSHPGVVIKTNTNNELLPRNTVAEVYAAVIEDIDFAIANLPASNGNYATSWTAKALKAKVALTMLDYQTAYDMANDVIENGPYTMDDASQFLDRFDPTISNESILTIVSTSNADHRGSKFSDNYRSDNNNNPAMRATQEMWTLFQAQATDARQAWVRQINPGTESEIIGVAKFDKDYFTVPLIHLTDMKLTRAESAAKLNTNLNQAIADVNEIKVRAYGSGVANLSPGASAADIIEAARYERRLEMAFEGDWLTHLKRFGVEGENIEIRGDAWNCDGMPLQFPVSERSDVFEMNPTGGC